MKRFVYIVTAVAMLSFAGHAEGPDEQYIQIYNLIQQGDRLANSGQATAARDKYQAAGTALQKLQSSYPNWNEQVVRFRLRYLSERTGGAIPTQAGPSPLPSAPAAPSVPAIAFEQHDSQVLALQQHIQRLEGDKAVLEAKLREALSAQPAAVDPRELARAEERIRHVEKEKELLRVALDQQRAQMAQVMDPAAVDSLRAGLAEANRQLAEQREMVATLAREKQILEGQVKDRTENSQITVLRAENESLRSQLVASRGSGTVAASRVESLEKELAEARKTLVTSEKTIGQLREERASLEKRLAAKDSAAEKAAAERITKLQKERDDALARLNQTGRQRQTGRNAAGNAADVSTLRSRLAVLEAQKVPYTPEELALFQQPVLKPAATPAQVASPALSADATSLIAEAETDFRSRRFAEAERKYDQASRLAQSNTSTLANLAAAQLEQNKMVEAEETLRRVLNADPNDAHAMTLLGIIRFRQSSYDEAFDVLSRAAQLDPKNAETQNYLGIALSQKGQRVAAETALRRAVQLAPGYANAHYNLAVVYATQKPPFVELARWHYQKALASGHPRSDEVEKLLNR